MNEDIIWYDLWWSHHFPKRRNTRSVCNNDLKVSFQVIKNLQSSAESKTGLFQFSYMYFPELFHMYSDNRVVKKQHTHRISSIIQHSKMFWRAKKRKTIVQQQQQNRILIFAPHFKLKQITYTIFSAKKTLLNLSAITEILYFLSSQYISVVWNLSELNVCLS